MKAQRVIERLCPNGYLWLFYTYCREYARQPVDLDDLVDGFACIRAKSEIEEIYNGQE
jgi:hypothetical protein